VTAQRRHYVKQQLGDEDGITNDAAQSEMLIFKTRRSMPQHTSSRADKAAGNNAENRTQAASRPGPGSIDLQI
jgi:hypothetical protein